MATCGITLAAWKAARSIGLGLILASMPGAALAAPSDGSTAEATAGTAQEHAQEHGEASTGEESHGHHANVVSVFLGHTSERVDGGEHLEQGFTFGFEYTRRFTPRFSFGGVVERAGGDIRGTLLIAQAFYRIVGELRLVAGPGVEFRDDHSEEPEHHGGLLAASEPPTRARDTTVFLVRVGAIYEFEFDRWIVAPTVAIDFVGRDEALVLGVSIGYAF